MYNKFILITIMIVSTQFNLIGEDMIFELQNGDIYSITLFEREYTLGRTSLSDAFDSLKSDLEIFDKNYWKPIVKLRNTIKLDSINDNSSQSDKTYSGDIRTYVWMTFNSKNVLVNIIIGGIYNNIRKYIKNIGILKNGTITKVNKSSFVDIPTNWTYTNKSVYKNYTVITTIHEFNDSIIPFNSFNSFISINKSLQNSNYSVGDDPRNKYYKGKR